MGTVVTTQATADADVPVHPLVEEPVVAHGAAAGVRHEELCRSGTTAKE
jgi:hypothetical protein